MVETGTREEILRVALGLFRGQGYDATSLRQIAERLGITKAAVYYHFRAKEQLVVELTRPFLDGLAAILATARDREGGPVSPEVLLGEYVDLIVAHHEVVNLCATDPAAINHPDVGLRGATLVRAFQAELVGPEASDADQVRAACAVGAVNAAAAIPPDSIGMARDHVLRAALAVLRSGTGEARRAG